MNCIFCHITCEPRAQYQLRSYDHCPQCHTEFRFSPDKLLNYWIYRGDYRIEIDLFANQTHLSNRMIHIDKSHLLTLNYIAKVNPDQAQDWINKILNLKAFF